MFQPEMLRRESLYWGLLCVLAVVTACWLTVMITRVNYGARAGLNVDFQETRPAPFDPHTGVETFAEEEFRIPRIIMGENHTAILIFNADTQRIVLSADRSIAITCRLVDAVALHAPVGTVGELEEKAPSEPIAVDGEGSSRLTITIPRSAIGRLKTPDSQGIISCRPHWPIVAAPTFTDRALAVHGINKPNGMVFVDVSALDDVDDLRFSGGVEDPLAGERTRLLVPVNDSVSAAWSDVVAEERRDIVLVVVGALFAIAAALAIETIRPFVEHGRKRTE